MSSKKKKKILPYSLFQPHRIQVSKDNHRQRGIHFRSAVPMPICCPSNSGTFRKHKVILILDKWLIFHVKKMLLSILKKRKSVGLHIATSWSVVPMEIKRLRKQNCSALVKIKRKYSTRWYLISLGRKHPAGISLL